MFHAKSGEAFKVAVMIRSSCFADARARGNNTSPGPKAVYARASTAVQHALLSGGLSLPELHECLEALKDDGETLAVPAEASSV